MFHCQKALMLLFRHKYKNPSFGPEDISDIDLRDYKSRPFELSCPSK